MLTRGVVVKAVEREESELKSLPPLRLYIHGEACAFEEGVATRIQGYCYASDCV